MPPLTNKEIDELDELTTVASNDYLPIFDTSTGGEAKRISQDNLNPAASASVAGKVELATTGETETGTDATRAVTPDGLHDMTTLAGAAWMKDEDNMASNDATKVPSQQSVKAYADASIVTAKADLTKYSNLYAPQGFLINGKIVPSVASNVITLAIKTMAGADATATTPIYVRIGDTIRTITAALAVTVNAGANYLNLGSAELGTNEADLFAYLFWKAADSTVVLAFARFPTGALYSDFSSDTANEKGVLPSATPAATDECVLIGRFAATLSLSGTGYLWSVPTYTAATLIQRPIYDTRKLLWTPAFSCSGSMTFGTITQNERYYYLRSNKICIDMGVTGTTGGTPSNELCATLPWTPDDPTDLYSLNGYTHDSSNLSAWGSYETNHIYVRSYASGNYGAGSGRGFTMHFEYFI